MSCFFNDHDFSDRAANAFSFVATKLNTVITLTIFCFLNCFSHSRWSFFAAVAIQWSRAESGKSTFWVVWISLWILAGVQNVSMCKSYMSVGFLRNKEPMRFQNWKCRFCNNLNRERRRRRIMGLSITRPIWGSELAEACLLTNFAWLKPWTK